MIIEGVIYCDVCDASSEDTPVNVDYGLCVYCREDERQAQR